MVNSSAAYCLHLFLASAFKSVLHWIPLFCLFCVLIGPINGTDVATLWKHTRRTKASFINCSFYNFVELQCLLVLANEASEIRNDLYQFWVTWVPARPLSPSFFFFKSPLQRRKLAGNHKLKYLCWYLWNKWLRIFRKLIF